MQVRLLLTLFVTLSFASLRAQIESVGLIGTATPGGWDFDTNMVQDIDSAHLWTMTIMLNEGAAKFRANDAWTINWGSDAFPIGVGTQDGPDIPVQTGGMHDISFNSNTGEYYFSVQSDIGIIGSAAPFGWDADVNMYQSAEDTNSYTLRIELASGELKFRANDDWAVNWGAMDFPTGTGVQDGPNIPIAMAGEYNITFNKSTGDYSFTLVGFSTVGIIGDATPGGWDTPTAMNATSADGWELGVILTDGGLQFSGENGLVIWGGSDFPEGTATIGGDTIPVPAGNWVINFNSETLEYSFTQVVYYSTVGIIGDATPGGWDNDTDMTRDPVDSSLWTLRVELLDGEAKFRADDDWAVNWGAGDFPTGTAERDGANIPVTAGEYNITFNSFTGFYRFQEIVTYDRIGLVGTGTPLMSWDIDVFLTQDESDENLWYLNSVDMVDGESKFRADSNWTVNWGANSWPSGVGTQDGPNIPITGGTYGVTLNSATGEYAFGDPLSTRDLLNPASIKAYPNPATTLLNVDISEIEMHGEVQLLVFDAKGQMILSETQDARPLMQLNVEKLQNGYYTLHISNEKYIIGKKFVIAK